MAKSEDFKIEAAEIKDFGIENSEIEDSKTEDFKIKATSSKILNIFLMWRKLEFCPLCYEMAMELSFFFFILWFSGKISHQTFSLNYFVCPFWNTFLVIFLWPWKLNIQGKCCTVLQNAIFCQTSNLNFYEKQQRLINQLFCRNIKQIVGAEFYQATLSQ